MANVEFTPIVIDTGTNILTPTENSTPAIPRLFTPKSEERYVSFVLEMKGASSANSIQKLEKKINYLLCTKLSGYFSELLYFSPNIFKIHKAWIKTKKIPKGLFQEKADLKSNLTTSKLKNIRNCNLSLRDYIPDPKMTLKVQKNLV